VGGLERAAGGGCKLVEDGVDVHGIAEAWAEPETTVVCVDKRRQWGRAGNVRHSSAFRSGIHTATAPLRKRR